MDSNTLRQRALRDALSDPTSATYKAMSRMLMVASAEERLARARVGPVTLPFQVPLVDVRALEEQFQVPLRIRGSVPRVRLTPRVAGLVHIVETALLDKASGGGRSVLAVDGDLLTMVHRTGSMIVEHTASSARLTASNFQEIEELRVLSRKLSTPVGVKAAALYGDILSGGGERFWPRVRESGPRCDAVVFNHFKTSGCIAQLVELTSSRASLLFGAFPFQLDFFLKEKGSLDCFPGSFHVDREADVISLIPAADPSMSISHPYSALCVLARTNTVTVGGEEWLCERYMHNKGIMYYTLRKVGAEYDAPEVLRTHYFNAADAGVSVVSFPEVVRSDFGVVVGFRRRNVRIWTHRLEKVLFRLENSTSALIQPAEAFLALASENSRTLNSFDSVVVCERMPVEDEMALAVALATHVNWRRHALRGTLKVLLAGVKERTKMADAGVGALTCMALMAWWQRMQWWKPDLHVSGLVEDELPVPAVLDECGTDFTVVVRECDPWVTVEQEAGYDKSVRSGQLQRNVTHPITLHWDGVSEVVNSDGTEGWAPWMRKPEKWDPVKYGKSIVAGFLKRIRGGSTCAVAERAAKFERGANLVDVVTSGVIASPSWSRPTLGIGPKTLLKAKLTRDFDPVRESLPENEQIVYEVPVYDDTLYAPVPDVDPKSAILSDAVDLYGLPERDVLATGHELARVDFDRTVEGNFSINDLKRNIPKAIWVRRANVDLGVEGTRVQSQAALVAAMFKRNVGVPDNRGSVDLHEFPEATVDKIIEVCYRDDWERIVAKHLDSGMWEVNDVDLDGFLANIDEVKARRMLTEVFEGEANIDLTRWMLMAKGKIKPGREADADMKVDHSQTIMYLESSTVNALYSSMLRRFKECVDECLLPEISLNSQRSDEDQEKWYNSLEPRRRSFPNTWAYMADIKCFDRSQDQIPLRVDLAFYKRHGLSMERLRIWEQTHGVKRATSMMFGVVLWVTLGGVSGLWKTLFRNGLVNLAAIITATGVRRGEIVGLDIKGDDLDAEFSRPVDIENTIDGFALNFNFAAKFFGTDVRYMCKQFRFKLNGQWYFVSDMWARLQSALAPARMSQQADTLAERWESLKADLRHYDNVIVLDCACEHAQAFYQLVRPPYGSAYALSFFSRNKNAYLGFFGPPERID